MTSPLQFAIKIDDLGIGLTRHNDVEIYASSEDYRPSVRRHEVKFLYQSNFKIDAKEIGQTNPDNQDEHQLQNMGGNFQDDENVQFVDKYLYFSISASTAKSLSFTFK